jgi:hypothetical protein
MPGEASAFDIKALKARIDAAFAADARPPAMSLRAGDAIDSGLAPPPWDASLDTPGPAYLDAHYCGLGYLYAQSWRHYLPILMHDALDRFREHAPMSILGLLFSLRPPDREPSRFGSLSPEQEATVSQFLDVLAFDPLSQWVEEAITALEEYWAPGAIHRRSGAVP